MEINFNDICKSLSIALIDDFRGFLENGTVRIPVKDDELHAVIAYQEMSKDPSWVYESGSGQNPIVEYMQSKKAIYLTRISVDPIKHQYQRTVGYLTDAYLDQVNYKGTYKPAYQVLRQIALGMGYDVDEYTLAEKSDNGVKNPVSITNYKASIVIKESKQNPKRSLKDGDKPVFAHNGNLVGFFSNGKFVNINNYERYSHSDSKDSQELDK